MTNTNVKSDAQLRKNLLAQIHIGKKDLGLDEDTYRDLVEQATGLRSAGDCSIKQLYDIISVINAKGGDIKPAKRNRYKKPFYKKEDLELYCGSQKPKNEQESMVFGLWCDICKAGKAKNPTPAGLRGLCQHTTKKASPRFCNHHELNNLIEALKAILGR